MMFQRKKRFGATLVESAIVYPVTFLLLLGLLVGAMGIFRYQEMASLSREAARYASVHGGKFAKDSGTPAPGASDIYNQVIVPKAAGLDLSLLSYSITWNTDNNPYHVKIVNGDVLPVTNTVTVTLAYRWIPEVIFGGVTLTSSSVMTMAY